MNAVQKLRQLVGEIAKGPASAMQAWPVAQRLLSRMPLDQAEIERVCKARDPIGLDVLVTRLEGAGAPVAAAPRPAGPAVSEEDMRAALKAFSKRLKLARLSDESRLGNLYTTGGRASKIDAIQPPEEFPPDVWKALVAAGKLKDAGQGFYAPA
ncbi:MAG TPA: hypothetical protein VFF69_02080 [Phycisphaerales bacterium]|nr:hypothetical protein [Phycisphaerales bacterium]